MGAMITYLEHRDTRDGSGALKLCHSRQQKLLPFHQRFGALPCLRLWTNVGQPKQPKHVCRGGKPLSRSPNSASCVYDGKNSLVLSHWQDPIPNNPEQTSSVYARFHPTPSCRTRSTHLHERPIKQVPQALSKLRPLQALGLLPQLLSQVIRFRVGEASGAHGIAPRLGRFEPCW